ncbi:MAG: hypothetical protein BWY75_03067 [bacterium ADurb.Bin425]|nr:MAG: hypothetical protein BWY75_03067 [bacterium ADurb.Bin425]
MVIGDIDFTLGACRIDYQKYFTAWQKVYIEDWIIGDLIEDIHLFTLHTAGKNL